MLAVIVVAIIMVLRIPVDAQTSQERTLYVSAVNDKGEPVEGLGPDAFVVREDGVRREVLRVSAATEPIDIALLVDNSQAVRDSITFMRESVSRFVERMAPKNQIALIGLADRPTILVDYTNDPKRLASGVGRLFAMPASGMTLLDAVFETSQGMRKREGPRAAIVAVFTDGREFTNRYSRDVAQEARRAEVPVYLIGVGRFLHSEEQSTRERSFFLEEGPDTTGGERITILAPMALPDVVDRVARELSKQYKVVYSRPESLIPPEKVEVSSARAEVMMHGAPARGEGRGTK
jgi:VWFA-related protein